MKKLEIIIALITATTIFTSLTIICMSKSAIELNIQLNILKASITIEIKKSVN